MGSVPSLKQMGDAVAGVVRRNIAEPFEAKAKQVEKKTGATFNGEIGKTSRKFGETDGRQRPEPRPGLDYLDPGYGDPFAGYSKKGYSEPGSGFQLDLGRRGDPSNPFPMEPTPIPANDLWEAPRESAPQAVPHAEQLRRLKYRKYAKNRGL